MDIVIRYNVSKKVLSDWKPSDSEKKNPKVHKYIAADNSTACHKTISGKDARWRIDRGSSATQPKVNCIRCMNATSGKPGKSKGSKKQATTVESVPDEYQDDKIPDEDVSPDAYEHEELQDEDETDEEVEQEDE